jgi:hypothetical protein
MVIAEEELAAEQEGTGSDDQVGEPPPRGRWRRAADAPELSAEQRAEISDLEAIGYASGTRPPAGGSGVTVHLAGRALAGLNFFVSGHTSGAGLMDMDGRVLHTWSATVEDVWPDPAERGRTLLGNHFWRRAHLEADGAVLAIFEAHSLVKLDRDSRVVWKNRCGAHHDLEVLDDGDILVLTREVKLDPARGPKPFLEDFVTRLGPDGREKRRVSVLAALRDSRFTELAALAAERHGDVLHTNTLARLDGRFADRLPAFRAGNLLLSSRELSFLAVLDPEAGKIVWTMRGEFREQHDPQLLDSGNLLLFDNGGRRRASAVLELDPQSGATLWEYRGSASAPFHSDTCGTAARLANGNTLITESDNGRAFEVDRAGEIVWEFRNPARAGPEGEYVATLFEVVRLAPELPTWLEHPR